MGRLVLSLKKYYNIIPFKIISVNYAKRIKEPIRLYGGFHSSPSAGTTTTAPVPPSSPAMKKLVISRGAPCSSK